jgi:acetolactate synthase I/II/III large subunit
MSNSHNSNATRLAGHVLVDALVAQDVDHVFCVPGESYLAVLDGLHDVNDRIKTIVCRQEGGAANMAEAYGKLTGKPGICMVTRGPGATNASIGVHTAFQDSTPMVLFIGQIGSDCTDREAFQEVDYRQMFGPLAKWVGQIDRADRVAEYVSHAFHVAQSGRKGPVVLALPEDMLTTATAPANIRKAPVVQASPSVEQMQQLQSLLTGAKKPLAILGGSGWTSEAREQFTRWCEVSQLPISCAFRFQDSFDNNHPLYCGDVGIGINPKLAARVKDADVLLVLGPRLGEMTTSGYTLIDIPMPKQKLIHVHTGASELGRVYQGELLINSGMPEFIAMLDQVKLSKDAYREYSQAARADYEAWQAPVTIPGGVQMFEVMQHLNATLPADAILTNGAGNYATWLHRYYRFRGFKTQLAPTSGAMGYGAPAAVAAKIVAPNRDAICFAGDGCFLMNGQELATAVQYNAGAIFLVINNGMYGTIRMHQEKTYPARVQGTELVNPDFAAYARAFGAMGETVLTTAEFAPAFARALAHTRGGKGPALLELRIDPQAITPTATLDAMRKAAQKQ